MDVSPDRYSLTERIAAKVRDLRKARQWTQAQLADSLGVSQSRLSDLERGRASFTAEQFLTLLRLFNVPASEFADASSSFDSELQNALARLGAQHLIETGDSLPSERLRNVHAVVREVLAAPRSPRMVTALAPVLVEHADELNLSTVALELREIGLERRVFWLAANIQEGVLRHLATSPPASRARKLRRAQLVLGQFLDAAPVRGRSRPIKLDVLDRPVRSAETVQELMRTASPASKRWGVVTALQVEDFFDALRLADGSV